MRSRHQPRFDLHNKSRVLCFVLVVVLFWVRDLSWVSPAAGGAPLHRPESPGCSTPLSRSSTSFHTRKTRNTHTLSLLRLLSGSQRLIAVTQTSQPSPGLYRRCYSSERLRPGVTPRKHSLGGFIAAPLPPRLSPLDSHPLHKHTHKHTDKITTNQQIICYSQRIKMPNARPTTGCTHQLWGIYPTCYCTG